MDCDMSTRTIDLKLNTPLMFISNDARNDLVGRIRLNVNSSLLYDLNLFSNSLTIANVLGILRFHLEGEKEYNIEMTSDSMYFNNDTTTTFSTGVKKYEIDLLNKWRKNRDINLRFEINGLVLSNNQLISVSGDIRFKYTNDELGKNILDSSDLFSGYIRTLDLEISQKMISSDLDRFFDHVTIFHNNLKTALIQMRKANDVEDFNRILSQIRVPLDSLKKLRHDSDIMNGLVNMIESTDTIAPLSVTQPATSPNPIAKELVESLFDLLEIILLYQ